MTDLLSSQLTQLAFAVVTGQHRLTDDQRAALADLNAAAAHVQHGPATVCSIPTLRLAPYSPTKEPA